MPLAKRSKPSKTERDDYQDKKYHFDKTRSSDRLTEMTIQRFEKVLSLKSAKVICIYLFFCMPVHVCLSMCADDAKISAIHLSNLQEGYYNLLKFGKRDSSNID